MTEDERVRTAEQERDSRARGKKKDGKTGAREKKGDDGAAKRGNGEGGCFASVTWRYPDLLVSAGLLRRPPPLTSVSLFLSLFPNAPLPPDAFS